MRSERDLTYLADHVLGKAVKVSSMGWRSLAIVAGLLMLGACSDDAPSDRAKEPPLKCQTETTDGCLTLRNSTSSGPGRSYVHLSTKGGDPVRQYGISSTLLFGRGNVFTRPLQPGEYVVSFFEGGPKDFSETSWMSDRACGREFRIREGRIEDFRLVWPRRSPRCTIERR